MTSVSTTAPTDLDRVNRAEWAKRTVVGQFGDAGSGGRLDTWSDPGEQAALSAIASEIRGKAILDVGVGGGRTTRFLRLVSDDYVAVDYTPEMVEVCRTNFPGVDVREGDARSLDDFADETFDLVVFSYNGLDAISHVDRVAALEEMARVLAPGGLLFFSTHNKSGPCYRATPLHPAGSPVRHTWTRGYRIGFATLRLLTAPIQLPRASANFRKLRRVSIDRPDWGEAPNEAHDFGLLVHYVTRRGLEDELRDTGLVVEACLDAEYGRPLAADEDTSGVRYFQVLARKPL